MPKKVDIDPDKVKMLASFGCSFIEIGKYFAVDEGVIRKKYRTEYEQGKQEMKLTLRQLQWKHAQNGKHARLDSVTKLQPITKDCAYHQRRYNGKAQIAN
jgi:hypothetical protein